MAAGADGDVSRESVESFFPIELCFQVSFSMKCGIGFFMGLDVESFGHDGVGFFGMGFQMIKGNV